MEELWQILSRGSPISVGIFLMCLGGQIYLISKADENSKHTKVFAGEAQCMSFRCGSPVS